MIIRMRNIPMSFDGSVPLKTASVHMIDLIGKFPGYNLTDIAEHLGVTKGAVSQMAALLEKKGVIERKKGEGNNICFSLTPEGRKVFNGHERYHKDLYAKLARIIGDYSEEDLNKLDLLMSQVEKSMLEYSENI